MSLPYTSPIGIFQELTKPRLFIFENSNIRRLGMSRKSENTNFVCAQCGKSIVALTNGSYRNHCPFCLYSLHVDEIIGDRNSNCNGLMKPIGIEYNSKKGYQIVHLCNKCNTRRVNRVAENTIMPDDFEIILNLIN